MATDPIDTSTLGPVRVDPDATAARAMMADGWATARLEAAYPDEECGCPVEEWTYGGIWLQLHFEPDGSLEIFADAGDWDREVALKAPTIEDARREAFAWVDVLPKEA